jgi:hypothetical protein
MGKSINGILNLEWYEALYLFEIGALKVDVDYVYGVLMKDKGVYAVYRELKGLGYFVMGPSNPSCRLCKSKDILCLSRIERLLGFGRSCLLSFEFAKDGLAVFTRNDEEIYRRIRIVPKIALIKKSIEGTKDVVDFNVYIPRSKFKKSKPGSADFRVVVKNASEEVFDLKELQSVFDGREGDVKLAIVENSLVSFLSLNAVVHPQDSLK